MTRSVHRLEVLPFEGLESGEEIQERDRGVLRLEGLRAARWIGSIIVTDRRLIFEGATWQVRLSEIESVSIEPRPRWVVRLLVLILDSAPYGAEALIRLRDGRALRVSFDHAPIALRVDELVRAHGQVQA